METQQKTQSMILRERQVGLREYLTRAEPQLRDVLPAHVTPQKIVRLTMLSVVQNPKLLECTRESILLSVMECARLGLEPGGVLGHAWLVPFKTKRGGVSCQMILGWKGMVHLAYRSPRIQRVAAAPVLEGDVFRYVKGTRPEVCHVPSSEPEEGRTLTHAYAIAWVDGVPIEEVLERWQVEKARKRSRAMDSGPWASDYNAMARKTAVRALSPFLPLQPEEQHVIERDVDREYGTTAPGEEDIDVPEEEGSWTTDLRHKAEEAKAESSQSTTP